MFSRIIESSPGTLKGWQGISTALKQMASGKGESLFKELYTANELSRLGRFANALDEIIPKGDFARSSGTAERITRYMDDLLKGLPFVGLLKQAGNMLSSRAVFDGAPAVAPRLIPAAGAATQTIPPL
jgi:hypothetical protein